MIHFLALASVLIIGIVFYDALKANVIPDSPEVEMKPDVTEAFYTDYFDNKN